MPEGFTGFHPAAAKELIRTFEEKGKEIHAKVKEANQTFLNGLAVNWYSPFAVEFGSVEKKSLYEAQETITLLFTNMIYDCVSAYNAIASSNDIPTITDTHERMNDGVVDLSDHGSSDEYATFREVGEGHLVGMNTAEVDKLLADYGSKIHQVVDVDLNEIPMDIAFYDPGDELKTAFKENVKALQETLVAKIDEVTNKMNEHAEEEMRMVVEGAENAAEAMSGSGE